MKTYIHGVRHSFKVGEIVSVNPAQWREQEPFSGKIREITDFGGLYISTLRNKKSYSATSVYYGSEEVKHEI